MKFDTEYIRSIDTVSFIFICNVCRLSSPFISLIFYVYAFLSSHNCNLSSAIYPIFYHRHVINDMNIHYLAFTNLIRISHPHTLRCPPINVHPPFHPLPNLLRVHVQFNNNIPRSCTRHATK